MYGKQNLIGMQIKTKLMEFELSNNQNGILSETLQLAGVDDKLLEIISHGYNDESIKATHSETNKLIQQCLNTNSLGECIHIAGEMRALTDPFHRYICDEINHKEKNVFRIVYNLPKELIHNSTEILRWNLENWVSDKLERKWFEELRTIYSIANRSVNLYAMDTSNEIQYSVFGDRYILLQEKHSEKTTQKNTWLLKSEKINSILTVKADNLIKASQRVDAGNYRKFTQSLNGVVSKRFLSLLKKSSYVAIQELIEDDIANDFCESPHEILNTLEVMMFVDIKDNEFVSLTKSGREFSE